MAMRTEVPVVARELDQLADSVLVSLNDATVIAHRSIASLYRDEKAGRLKFKKVGGSTRISVGDLRRLIGAAE